MKVEMVKLSQLKPYKNNPRINDMAVDAVAASIKEFGFRQPIVCDESMVIIVGHTRYKAASRLGMDEVPVHVAGGLTEAQKKAYRIADNRTAEIAEWDFGALSMELSELQELGDCLSDTGLDEEMIERLLSSVEDAVLPEKKEDLRPIKYTRILVSIPVGMDAGPLDEALKHIVQRGAEIDYGGN